MTISGDLQPQVHQSRHQATDVNFSWDAIGSVVTGAGHLRANSECQDAILIHKDETGYVVAAVADGHGSKACPYSADGAKLAVGVSVRLLCQVQDSEEAQFTLAANKDDRIPKQLEIMWKEAVRAHHAKTGREACCDDLTLFTQYGTTLNVVAASKDFVFFIKIGDGDVLMVSEDGAGHVLEPEEKVGEDTESLCLDEAWKFVRTQIMQVKNDRPLMFLVSTDGYSNSFADKSGFLKAGKDFYKLCTEDGLEYIENSLEDWLRASSDKGSGDDISLAIIFLSEGS